MLVLLIHWLGKVIFTSGGRDYKIHEGGGDNKILGTCYTVSMGGGQNQFNSGGSKKNHKGGRGI